MLTSTFLIPYNASYKVIHSPFMSMNDLRSKSRNYTIKEFNVTKFD